MEKDLKDFIKKIDSTYNCIREFYSFIGKEEKIFIGNESARKCRYCGKERPDVGFKNEAHTLSKFIGNKYLLSYDECNNCNGFFSNLETELAKYINPLGKKFSFKEDSGVISYKGNKYRIDSIRNNTIIIDYKKYKVIEINNEKGTLIISTRRHYIPIRVYKCFTKMALSIMPEDELVNFQDTLKWILEKDQKKSEYTLNNLRIYFKLFDESNKEISCFLLRRKDNHKDNVPYMLFILKFLNFIVQIHIPLCTKDQTQLSKKIPEVIEIFPGLIKYQDLSDKKKVKETINIPFKKTF